MTYETIELTEVFRQHGEPEFAAALNLIRTGDASGLDLINTRAGVHPEGEPVALCFTNRHAKTINDRRLAAIEGEARTFTATVLDGFKEADAPVATEIVLKVGAQVMIAKNITSDFGERYVNGSVGVVTGFADSLRTIQNPDECYPQIVTEGSNCAMVTPNGDGTWTELIHGCPVVELRDGRTLTVYLATWEKSVYAIDLETDRVTTVAAGSFTQVPLKLAYASTIHKAQGATLDAAVLESEIKGWAHGLLYCALSRTRSINGLYLKRKLGPSDLIVHPRIKEVFGKPEPERNLEVF